MFEDIDECTSDSICAAAANCANTLGGFECRCLPGFLGNGRLKCTEFRSRFFNDTINEVAGQYTEFPCKTGNAVSVVWWFFESLDSRPVELYNQHGIHNDFESRMRMSQPHNSLFIIRIELNDTGFYVCFDGASLDVLNIVQLNVTDVSGKVTPSSSILDWKLFFFVALAIVIILLCVLAYIYINRKITEKKRKAVSTVQKKEGIDKIREDSNNLIRYSRSFKQMEREKESSSHKESVHLLLDAEDVDRKDVDKYLLKLYDQKSSAEFNRFNEFLYYTGSDVRGRPHETDEARSTSRAGRFRKSLRLRNNTEVIPGNGSLILDLTIMNDELFVLSYPTYGRIIVYDKSSLVFKRNVDMCGVINILDDGGIAASCANDEYLYLCNYTLRELYKFELSRQGKGKASINWKVSGIGNPRGISVNNEGILLTCWGSNSEQNKLMEYTKDGILTREILLLSEMMNPLHTVQLPSGQFVVALERQCDQQLQSCICKFQVREETTGADKIWMIDKTTVHYKTLIDKVSNFEDGNRCELRQVTLGPSNTVFVTSSYSGKVIILDSLLQQTKRLSLFELKRPNAIHFDEAKNVLYVGNWDGDVVVVKNAGKYCLKPETGQQYAVYGCPQNARRDDNEAMVTANRPKGHNVKAQTFREDVVLLTSDNVAAIASIGDELFVACQPLYGKVLVFDLRIKISNIILKKPLREIVVDSLDQISYSVGGMAACENGNCLYLSDMNSESVYKIELCHSTPLIKKINVGGRPLGVSVTSRSTLLVAAMRRIDSGSLKNQSQQMRTEPNLLPTIIEFTPNGEEKWRAKDLCLPPNFRSAIPSHAVSFDEDILVSFSSCGRQGNFSGCICVVDREGKIRNTYVDSRLKEPIHMSISENYVFVADRANDQIVVLDKELKYCSIVTEVPTGKLSKPQALCLYNGKLLVAGNGSGYLVQSAKYRDSVQK